MHWYIFYQKALRINWNISFLAMEKMIKKKIGESMERWVENDGNLTAWHDEICVKKGEYL